jgi:hypothetical protein
MSRVLAGMGNAMLWRCAVRRAVRESCSLEADEVRDLSDAEALEALGGREARALARSLGLSAADLVPCEECGGSGVVKWSYPGGFGIMGRMVLGTSACPRGCDEVVS